MIIWYLTSCSDGTNIFSEGCSAGATIFGSGNSAGTSIFSCRNTGGINIFSSGFASGVHVFGIGYGDTAIPKAALVTPSATMVTSAPVKEIPAKEGTIY